MISSNGRNPYLPTINMPQTMSAVIIIPGGSGILHSNDSPIAPPRNSARSVAIAAISLTIHIAHTTGCGKLFAAHLGEIAAGDDAELGRERLKQHREIGEQHDP
jgi:hypothetical protein